MNPSEMALRNAIPLEVKKDGLQQRQNGDWVLRLVIQAADMDARITTAAMGTRFVAAMVEVGDDELPKLAKPKANWQDVTPAAQAGIRCAEPMFQAFLREQHGYGPSSAEDDVAVFLRGLCGVQSRSELSSNHKARVIWHQLDQQYQAWKAAEHA